MELVRDDDDALAVVPHVAQDGEELVRLLRREDGGGLVQDEDVRAAVEDLHYLDGLLLGDGHVVYLLLRVHLEAVGLADGLYLLSGAVQIEPPLAGQAQDDVLRRGEHVHQLEVLVYHAYAEVEGVLGRADGDFLPVHEDLALVGVVDAGEHVHERGLAAAVFAQQRQDLAPVDVEPDLVVGRHRAEALRDVPHLYRCGLAFHGLHSLNNIKWPKGQRGRVYPLRCPLGADCGADAAVCLGLT